MNGADCVIDPQPVRRIDMLRMLPKRRGTIGGGNGMTATTSQRAQNTSVKRRWEWSDDAAVQDLLPTSKRDLVSLAAVNKFTDAAEADRFEALRILRSKSQEPDAFFAAIAVLIGVMTLVVTGYVGGSKDAASFVTLVIIGVLCAVGVFVASSWRRETLTAEAWRTAYEAAAPTPSPNQASEDRVVTLPLRRWTLIINRNS